MMQIEAIVTQKVEVIQPTTVLKDMAEQEIAFEFNIGARVHCQDGPWGKLVKVAVNSNTRQLMGLIVQKDFLLQYHQVLPLAVVESTTSTDVYLAISSDDLETYPEYWEVEIRKPALPDLEPARPRLEAGLKSQEAVEFIVPMSRR